VLVIHENRGLNEHIRDVARRVAVAGYTALAPDFLSVSGGTPADEDAARAAIGKLDVVATVQQGVETLAHLATVAGRKAVGAVGFCWGGGMVNRLAIAAGDGLAAGVSYYGPVPGDLMQVARIRAAMLLHYAGLDERINAGIPGYDAALKAAKVRHEIQTYPGVNHAFNNDTSAARYDKAAAELAWARTLGWFKANLR
jgi:carboxymethylenebutenolidase